MKMNINLFSKLNSNHNINYFYKVTMKLSNNLFSKLNSNHNINYWNKVIYIK
jgi:hypothetical protein